MMFFRIVNMILMGVVETCVTVVNLKLEEVCPAHQMFKFHFRRKIQVSLKNTKHVP